LLLARIDVVCIPVIRLNGVLVCNSPHYQATTDAAAAAEGYDDDGVDEMELDLE
jgi:hypothetical protein